MHFWRWISVLLECRMLPLPFATDGGQAPTGETDPFLDKIPWPVRQKEASRSPWPSWQFRPSQWALVMLSGSSIAPLNPLCSVYTSASGGDVTSKSLCLQPNWDRISFFPGGALVPKLVCTLESPGEILYKFRTDYTQGSLKHNHRELGLVQQCFGKIPREFHVQAC